jgi:hypothetical protein
MPDEQRRENPHAGELFVAPTGFGDIPPVNLVREAS